MRINVEQAIEYFKEGHMLIMTDNEDRENEGDFVMPAHAVTPDDINFIASKGRGLICAAITRERRIQLRLQPQVAENSSIMETNFTVSVDALDHTTTGISTADRAKTLNLLADPGTRAEELGRPGHIFPIWAKPGGVLERPGHTEGVTDLAKLAGFDPAVGMLCEVLKEDGTMARMPDLEVLSDEFDIPIITIHDLITWRIKNENHVNCEVTTPLANEFGEWKIMLYEDQLTHEEHIAMVLGDPQKNDDPLVRVHSQCFTGDTLGSFRCDCGPQLKQSMKEIAKEGSGIILYMHQEGRGIGLKAKLKAYNLQDQGRDTVEANLELGFKADIRDYGTSAQILRDLDISKVRLLTNNPEKISGLERYGFTVERVPLEVGLNEFNEAYMKTKKSKMGHILERLEQ